MVRWITYGASLGRSIEGRLQPNLFFYCVRSVAPLAPCWRSPKSDASEEARQQAQAEGLTLHVAENKSGYYGVGYRPGKPKPYQLRVRRGGKGVHLGSFVTAEEAALRLARFQAPLTKGK